MVEATGLRAWPRAGGLEAAGRIELMGGDLHRHGGPGGRRLNVDEARAALQQRTGRIATPVWNNGRPRPSRRQRGFQPGPERARRPPSNQAPAVVPGTGEQPHHPDTLSQVLQGTPVRLGVFLTLAVNDALPLRHGIAGSGVELSSSRTRLPASVPPPSDWRSVMAPDPSNADSSRTSPKPGLT